MIRDLRAIFGFKQPGQGKAFIDRLIEAVRSLGVGVQISAAFSADVGEVGRLQQSRAARRHGLRKTRAALGRLSGVIMHAMLRDGILFEA